MLDAALEIISEQGVAALTMDKLVARVPYSKGTVYNHFSGKEDLLVALCNSSMQSLLELFQRVLTFNGLSRHKMLAICFAYMLFAKLYPRKFMLVITAKIPAVSEKCSSRRQAEHQELDETLLGVAFEVIREALEAGELTLPESRLPEQVAFSVWAMCFGTIALLSEDIEQCSARSELLMEQEVISHSNIVLDGLGWQPDAAQSDMNEVVNRFKQELFAEEIEKLGYQGRSLKL